MRQASLLLLAAVVLGVAAFFIAFSPSSKPITAETPSTEDIARQALGEMSFHKTLHATTNGMKYWYDKGLGAKTGVQYETLFCVKCHATCETCHAEKTAAGEVKDYTLRIKMDTCLSCHGREKKALMLAEAGKLPGDIHMKGYGHTCMYCHNSKEIHGVGSDKPTMRLLVTTDCESCHGAGRALPAFEAIAEHKQHLKDLHCTACHVPTVVTCYNCHFDYAYKSYTTVGKVIKKAYPVMGWLLLVHDTARGNKVHSGGIMVILWKEKNAYQIDIAPQFPHIVVREGRHCQDCHATSNVLKILNTKQLTLTWWNATANKLEWVKGIVPIVEDVTYKIQLLEFDPNTNTWKPSDIVSFKPGQGASLINNAAPLTWEELEKLAEKQPQQQG